MNGSTAAQAFRRGRQRLAAARLHYGHGTDNAGDEAAWLLAHAIGVPPIELQAQAQRFLTPREAARFEKLIDRRIGERIPAAYLTHEAWLGEHSFHVDRRVIVPRSFIAELLDDGLEPWLAREPRRVLDLCCGSACLAIVAAHAFPRAKVDAADLSRSALTVAARNVERHRLKRRLRLMRSDLFAALPRTRYDLILCNPPYVNAPSMSRLPKEYRHEPRMALAGGADGLELVRRILAQAAGYLAADGALVCEIGHNRSALERAFPRTPFVWLETSRGDRHVFLLEAGSLPGETPNLRRWRRR